MNLQQFAVLLAAALPFQTAPVAEAYNILKKYVSADDTVSLTVMLYVTLEVTTSFVFILIMVTC